MTKSLMEDWGDSSMQNILIFILLVTSSSAALASGWEISTVNDDGDIHTINSDKIKRVDTQLSSTGTVISAWVRTTYSNTDDGIVSKLEEFYIKCKQDEIIRNSAYLYKEDGTVAQSVVNQVTSVDFAKFQPAPPESYGEQWIKDICSYSNIK